MRSLRGVEIPAALPLIITGLRVSAVQVVATATLGAYVGFGGLGAFIVEGFAIQDDGKLLTGAILVALDVLDGRTGVRLAPAPSDSLGPAGVLAKREDHGRRHDDGRRAGAGVRSQERTNQEREQAMTRKIRGLWAVLAVLALLAGACGDDGDDGQRQRHHGDR